MKSMKQHSLVLATCIAIAAPLSAQQPRADLILVNGRVLTVDTNDRIAQAVGIAGGRIVAPPITRMTLEDVPAALSSAQARTASGKTVITL